VGAATDICPPQDQRVPNVSRKRATSLGLITLRNTSAAAQASVRDIGPGGHRSHTRSNFTPSTIHQYVYVFEGCLDRRNSISQIVLPLRRLTYISEGGGEESTRAKMTCNSNTALTWNAVVWVSFGSAHTSHIIDGRNVLIAKAELNNGTYHQSA
jgi:hypothetical protein